MSLERGVTVVHPEEQTDETIDIKYQNQVVSSIKIKKKVISKSLSFNEKHRIIKDLPLILM